MTLYNYTKAFDFESVNGWKYLYNDPTPCIDPRGRPTVTAGSDHCFCTCRPFVSPSVRPYVRPHFSKQNKFQAKTMFATGETVGLAEWIIDDTCLVCRVG